MSHRLIDSRSVAHRRSPRRASWLPLLLAFGCTGGLTPVGEGGTGPAGAAATILGEIDTNHFCDMVGVIGADFRAAPEECDEGPPCDPLAGTVLTCPAVDPTLLAGVDVTQPGVYRVSVVGQFTTGEELPECFSAAGGTDLVEVTPMQIEAAAQIMLAAGHAPCPEN